MTAKLILSVRDVNGIATITYQIKERRRLYKTEFEKALVEFRAIKAKR